MLWSLFANLGQVCIGVFLLYLNMRHGVSSGLTFLPFVLTEGIQILFLIPGTPWRKPLKAINHGLPDLGFALTSANFWMLWNAIYTPKLVDRLPLLGLPFYLAGLVLSLISTIYLRPSFSVLPEYRVLVTGGPYKHISHPIYTGYVLMSLGQFLATLNSWMGAGWVLSTILYVARARQENKVLFDHI